MRNVTSSDKPMLVCSCNIITSKEIETVIDGFLADDPWHLITPSRVYHEMEKRGRCCGCFPNVVSLISARVLSFHAGLNTPESELLPFIRQINDVARLDQDQSRKRAA